MNVILDFGFRALSNSFEQPLDFQALGCAGRQTVEELARRCGRVGRLISSAPQVVGRVATNKRHPSLDESGPPFGLFRHSALL